MNNTPLSQLKPGQWYVSRSLMKVVQFKAAYKHELYVEFDDVGSAYLPLDDLYSSIAGLVVDNANQKNQD